MAFRQKSFIPVVVALALLFVPLTAHATAYTWTGGTTGAWETGSNWSTNTTGGPPSGTTNSATINTANTAVTLSSVISSFGIITLGSTDMLQLNTGASLKSNGITLNGGTITSSGTGTLASGTPISGYGTVSALLGVGTVTANAATYGNVMNISGITQNALTLGFGSKGTFNLSNVTVGASGNTGTALTFSGSTTYSQFTNPLAGTFGNNWGNSNYGLVNVTGNTTINGGISLNNYYVLNITNSTLTLNSPGTLGGFNTSAPPPFVLGTGGNLAITGNAAIGNYAPIPINGGSITHTGGTFSAYSFIGNGSISGVTTINGGGNVTASGGTLTFDGGTGVNLGSSGSGANLNSSAGSTLDLKGTLTYASPGFIAPNGGTVQLDGATIAAGTFSPTLSAGTINVTNNSTMTTTTGTISSAANLTINPGVTLTASGATFTNSGTVFNNGGTATWGTFTNSGVYKSDPSTQTFNNLTVNAAGSIQASAGDTYNITGDFINNSTQNTTWNTAGALLAFLTGTSTSHNVALAGADLGQTTAGMTDNFAWATLDLTGQTLNLSDGNAANTGTALYVGQLTGLTFDGTGTTVTDIFGNGANIYYDPSLNLALNGQTFNLENGGILAPDQAPVPIPPSALLLAPGLLGLVALRKKVKGA